MTTNEGMQADVEIPDRPRGGAETWYEVLDIPTSSTAAEIEQGYQRMLALVEGRTIGGYFLLDPMAVASARADVEAAYDVLKDPQRRAAYDAHLKDSSLPAPSPTTTQKAPSSSSSSSPPTPADDVTTTPPIKAEEKDETTDQDARELLGISTPSGEGVFAPMSPEGREKAAAMLAATAAALAAQPETTPPAAPPEPAPQTSQKPKPALKFLAPVEATRKLPVQDETVAVPKVELVATQTVLPTAAMPAPAASAGAEQKPFADNPKSGSFPVASPPTPQPMPGLFSLEGEVNGQLLKRLREARGLTIEQMVEATKIRKPYLIAIEEQDFENLPARVYLRGFLTQIARVVKVDKVKLAEGYLAFVARYGK